jgi:hypothetical protein
MLVFGNDCRDGLVPPLVETLGIFTLAIFADILPGALNLIVFCFGAFMLMPAIVAATFFAAGILVKDLILAVAIIFPQIKSSRRNGSC